MNKKESIETIKQYESQIGMWNIYVEEFSEVDFAIGYTYDEEAQQWKVYQNHERGMTSEWYFTKEEDAIEKLIKKLNFLKKISS